MESERLMKTKQTSEFDFFLVNHNMHVGEKGNLYTWGSGEMGQLGYNSKIIS